MTYNRFVCFALTLLVTFALPPSVHARQQQGEVVIPKDLTFALELLSPISTETNKKDDKFECKILSPVEYASATVSGHLRKVKRAGKGKGKSEIDLSFDTITLADGRTGRFNAQVKEVNDVVNAAADGRADEEGTVKGKSRVKVSVKRALVGAAVGGILGGLIGGSQGAAAGMAIGASIGVTSTLAAEGPNLEFKSGTQFTVLTNAPTRRPKAGAQTTASRPAPPPPSATYRTYSGAQFSLSVPDNWREHPMGVGVALAPDGSVGTFGGEQGYTHGAMIGIAPAQGRGLRQATELLVGGMMRQGNYLKQQGDYLDGNISGRQWLAASLSGMWPAGGYVEATTVYTTTLSNGDLFFLITSSPETDLSLYRPVFQTMVNSVKFNGQ